LGGGWEEKEVDDLRLGFQDRVWRFGVREGLEELRDEVWHPTGRLGRTRCEELDPTGVEDLGIVCL
jgi:hypothetical protein